MPHDIPDPDFEPAWLWATRVTAEAARAALVEGRTPQERFAIYERLILAACGERQRCESPEHSSSIVDAATSTPNSLLYSCIDIDNSIGISKFEEDTDINL